MDTPQKQVSTMDEEHLATIRANVSMFIKACGQKYDAGGVRVLDVAPQDHEGAKPYFPRSVVETLDIEPASKATYIADLCANNESTIPTNRFDIVVCTEVLEHTLQPFDAVKEIERLLKPSGLALVTVPFNFRIHGPLPDCWRFTEHGLRELFKDFDIIDLSEVEKEDRFLAPIHYTLIAQKRAA